MIYSKKNSFVEELSVDCKENGNGELKWFVLKLSELFTTGEPVAEDMEIARP